MSWSLGTVPGGRIGNDVAFATVAGYTFAWAGLTGGSGGGILSVRVTLRRATLADLARALGRLPGVRVTSGPAMSAGGGDCYVVHCPGFKMVLSSPEPGTDNAAGLVSRTAPGPVTLTSELATALDGLMRTAPRPAGARPSPETAAVTSTQTPQDPPSSTLRRAPLRPGKTLTRKAPLTRRTPLRRRPDSES
ncbi:MAG TPA: hypothetical protein VHM31_14785 [Polyangia bacterium]|nr:hypothetical protein [Polyangia bacterium]